MISQSLFRSSACALLMGGFFCTPTAVAANNSNPLVAPKAGVEAGKDRRQGLREWRDRKEGVREQRNDHRKRERIQSLNRRIRHLKQAGGDPVLVDKLETQRNRLKKSLRRDKRKDLRNQRKNVREQRQKARERRNDGSDRRQRRIR